MTDRFDEMAGRVQMDLAAFAMPTGTSARRVIADALRAAHACGVDEAAATIDLSMDDARELRRLALLGLETEAKLARVDADTGDWFARSYGAFPDLEPDTEPARDTRAERIGRAVLRELSDQGVELPGLRDGYASEGGIIAVIAAAMEDSDD